MRSPKEVLFKLLFIGNLMIKFFFIFSDRNDYTKNPYRVVCYFGSWANYHKIDPFLVEDIDTNLCTHINYAFAKLSNTSYQIEASDPWVDLKKENGNLGKFKICLNIC